MKIQCPDCGGFGRITYAMDTGPIGAGYFEDRDCESCDTDGEIDALCLACDEPLDERGFCNGCDERECPVCGTMIEGGGPCDVGCDPRDTLVQRDFRSGVIL